MSADSTWTGYLTVPAGLILILISLVILATLSVAWLGYLAWRLIRRITGRIRSRPGDADTTLPPLVPQLSAPPPAPPPDREPDDYLVPVRLPVRVRSGRTDNCAGIPCIWLADGTWSPCRLHDTRALATYIDRYADHWLADLTNDEGGS